MNASLCEAGTQIYFPRCSTCLRWQLLMEDDEDGGDDDVAEGLEEFMIRANGGICISLHTSLPNGRRHAEEMMIIIEYGTCANGCLLTCSISYILLTGVKGGKENREGEKEVKLEEDPNMRSECVQGSARSFHAPADILGL